MIAILLACFFAATLVAGGSEASRIAPETAPQASFEPAWEIDPWIREARSGAAQVHPASHPARIHLASGYTIDPGAPDPLGAVPASRKTDAPTGTERGHFLVQFDGPITQDDKDRIEREGGRVLFYVPEYALLIEAAGDDFERIADVSRVRWSGHFAPAFKMSDRIPAHAKGMSELSVLLFESGSMELVKSEVERLGGSIREESDNGINKLFRIEMDAARAAELAKLEAIAWIEPYVAPQLLNDLSQWVCQTDVVDDRRVWDMGIRGAGQVVNVLDSGLRTTHLQFLDSSVPLLDFGDYPTHRKVIAYKKSTESPNILFGDEGINVWHGTHVSGTAAGSDDPNGDPDLRDGVAPDAKIYFQDGGGPQEGILLQVDLNNVFIHPYNGNAGGVARISSNSWGGSVAGAYDLFSMTADQFMYEHPDFLLCFANGNDGSPMTVGSPATAKNVLSVGGTQNGTSASLIYSSTSRGPTADGRFKPTICAPGQSVWSANGGTDAAYWPLSGTSMATPGAAGSAALVRQYLTDGWYPTGAPVPANAIANPSAALVKAMLVNSGQNDVAGFTSPDFNIGWGRVTTDDVLTFPGDSRKLAVVDHSQGLLTGEYVEYQVEVANGAIPLKASLVWTDYPGSPLATVQLVNDLDLSVSDGVTTYKGNRYSGGQSIAGGSHDSLNVEENVRVNAPTPGIWTVRIDASNVPFGPQDFALVVTGGLASDVALVTLDRAVYGAGDHLAMRVVDLDAAGASVDVAVTSDTELGNETVTLNGGNGVFQGTFPTAAFASWLGDGQLSVSHDDEVTVTYDAGSKSGTLVATARINMNGPVLSGVAVEEAGQTSATVVWSSSAPSNSKIYYGTTPALGSESAIDPALVAAHRITVSGLLGNQTYYYDVESADNQGNTVRDDNGGAHYTFTTSGKKDVLLVIGDATFDLRSYYEDAFEGAGWSYNVWEGAAASTPFVGDENAGLASYKAVVWQVGSEQYPPFTDDARDSLVRYNDVGSRWTCFSHDVAWDFSDPSSPDFSVDRKDWFETELHAVYVEDPGTWGTNVGYAADPISGAYTGGISYTPHRSGAAGDEVLGQAGSGTVADVWENDDIVPGPVAIRWTGGAPVGNAGESIWSGTANRFVGNFFEWVGLNRATQNDATRADVLDKTLQWLIGHDHPDVALTSATGGETFTGSSVSISWTESVDAGLSAAARRIYYSDNSGSGWTLITGSAGSSPYNWDISAIPNGAQYRVRVEVDDDGAPVLAGSASSAGDFTIDRPGGDTRGPIVQAGSPVVDPNPMYVVTSSAFTATISDVTTGNANVTAAEWSFGSTPAPAGSGTSMSGSFGSPTVSVSATVPGSSLGAGLDTLWVRGQDANGQWGAAAALQVIVTSDPATDVASGVPGRLALHGNRPNPFNPTTAIAFSVPGDARVTLDVYDLAGRRVKTLVDRSLSAGSHTMHWTGIDDANRPVASGIYFYRLRSGAEEAVGRMILIR
ncbi:MAG: S8 family serine peptidase [Gemmatimonadetes bacterium]|nr:S8 family serine peptidase [Gemmatimonadota bacterium]